MNSAPHRLLGSVVALVVSAIAVHADASSENAALAQTLFEEGRRLMKEGKPNEACPKFEASEKLEPAAGTLLNLGICHAAIGKTATAWAELTESVARAKKDQRDDRLQIAQEELSKLTPKLSKLTIVLKADAVAPEESIELDGKPLDAGAWGVALSVDPGPHRVAAKAIGRKEWSRSIEIGPNADRQQIEVPPLDPVTSPSIAETTTVRGDSKRTWAFVVGGIGVAAAGFGTYFAVHAHSLASDTDSAFASGDPSAPSKGDDTRRAITFARIGLGVGIVALGTSAFLLLSSLPSGEASPEDHARVRVLPDFGAGWAGLSFSGGW